MTKRITSLKLYTILMIITTVLCKLPDYIQVCQRTDANIDQCIQKSIEHLKPFLKVGIPELNVPPLELLSLNSTLHFNVGSGDAQILTNLTNLVVYGAENFQLNQLWSDIEKNSFRYNVTIPRVNMHGIYQIDTKLLFLKIQGEGNFSVQVENYNFECVMSGHKVKIENIEHLKFDKLPCEIQFGQASIQLDNLFGGNQVLGTAVNDVVNENVDIFFKEVKPKIVEAIENVFLKTANRITLTFNYDDLFP
ncbi:hypothetical protein FQR65_LT08206 [Abscondita terminalis]|nr:hypothetical protein FQR65_LT08206 [Abscondita terminalis]